MDRFSEEQLKIGQKVYTEMAKGYDKHSGASFDIFTKMTLHAILDFGADNDFDKFVVTLYKGSVQITNFEITTKEIDAIKTTEDVLADIEKRATAN